MVKKKVDLQKREISHFVFIRMVKKKVEQSKREYRFGFIPMVKRKRKVKFAWFKFILYPVNSSCVTTPA
jgi:hypothetical protein